MTFKVIGEEIKNYSTPDEVIFLDVNKDYIEPQFIFYAKRNIASFESMNEAKKLIKLNGLDKGIIFILNKDKNNVKKIIKINLNE